MNMQNVKGQPKAATNFLVHLVDYLQDHAENDLQARKLQWEIMKHLANEYHIYHEPWSHDLALRWFDFVLSRWKSIEQDDEAIHSKAYIHQMMAKTCWCAANY